MVSHAVVNRILLAEALGLPDEDALRLDQSFCAVNVVDYRGEPGEPGESPLVRLVNAVP